MLFASKALVGSDLLSFDAILQAGGFEYPYTYWNALGRLLRRPWFTRIWVAQEVAEKI